MFLLTQSKLYQIVYDNMYLSGTKLYNGTVNFLNFNSSTTDFKGKGIDTISALITGWVMPDSQKQFQRYWDYDWNVKIDDMYMSGNWSSGYKNSSSEYKGDGNKWYSLYIYFNGNNKDNQNFTLSWNDTSATSYSEIPKDHFYQTTLVSFSPSSSPSANPLDITVAYSFCGDGLKTTGYENWEDGNTISGDGWNSSWVVETGWTWSGWSASQNDVCEEIWGDGKRFNSNTTYWDDGNTISGDGCSKDWQIEADWKCQGGNSTQRDSWDEIWGDGFRFNKNETYWDDGNLANGDGCSMNWKIEKGWNCTEGTKTNADVWKQIWGDGIRFDTTYNITYWDDGNILSEDGWNSLWVVESGWKWSGGKSTQKDECVQIIDQGMTIYLQTIIAILIYLDN